LQTATESLTESSWS